MGAMPWHLPITKEAFGHGMFYHNNRKCLKQVANALHKGARPYAWEWQAMGAMPWPVTELRTMLDSIWCYYSNKEASNALTNA